MLVAISFFVIWIILALLNGCRDSFYYHYRMTSIQQKNENIHWIYFCNRFVTWSLILIVHSMYFQTLSTGIYGASLILVFSFFHNGMYYLVRKKLSKADIYPKGWWSSSTSSQATIELNNVSRIFLLITGIIGFIASLQIKI